jgi:hypothetical protein
MIFNKNIYRKRKDIQFYIYFIHKKLPSNFPISISKRIRKFSLNSKTLINISITQIFSLFQYLTRFFRIKCIFSSIFRIKWNYRWYSIKNRCKSFQLKIFHIHLQIYHFFTINTWYHAKTSDSHKAY